jgi:hypothetical protein
MNTSNRSHPPVTELNQQTSRLTRELHRLINASINCIFALNLKGTRRRRNWLIALFLLVGFLLGFLTRSFSVWIAYAKIILLYLLNPAVAQSLSTNPIKDFSLFVWNTYKNSVVLRYLPIFVIPFIVAWQLAAIYLADIFESQVKIARSFIMHVALLGGRKTLRIREGDIASESEDSPVFVIGGPGLVVVELDSVAIFERSDGRPHIIGPTVDGPVMLDGFERFRQAINLRDHRTEALDIESRSLDGIPIRAVGVNFIFSVARENDQSPSAEHPYQYLNTSVIEALVYNEAAHVTAYGPRPADISKDWAGTMKRLIRNGLGDFMSQHNLTEYIANYGMPEIQSARNQVNEVFRSARRVLPPEGPLPSLSIEENPPAFIPRPTIKSLLFGDFAEAFPVLATQRGVELHWVGIGAWKTPSQIVPEQHLEAWQLSMDNQARQNDRPADLRAEFITHFIQDVPLTRFTENLARQLRHLESMTSLLIGYREQFLQILNIMEKKRERVNREAVNTILEALRHINRILGLPDDFPAHWVRANPPGNNDGVQTTRSAESAFQELTGLVGGDEATVDRLIEFERSQFPNATRIELIERAIARILRDRQ